MQRIFQELSWSHWGL